MELNPIGKEKLEISLTKKDMERFRLNAEKLDYSNTETRRAVWTILDTAKHKTGFDAAKGRIRIDALPSKSGGCVIFITKTQDSAQAEEIMHSTKEKYPAVAERPQRTVYSFSNLSDLLHVCLFLSVRGYSGESAAFREQPSPSIGNKYYLSLTKNVPIKEKDPYSVFENMFIGEFGKRMPEEHMQAYIKEHCECFCKKDAVKKLADMA